MPKEVTAQVAYLGRAVANGSMDVRELAPALLAIGDLLQEANRALNGDRANLVVHVESDFRQGSFEIKFALELVMFGQVVGMFDAGDPLQTAKQIAEYVGLITGKKPSLISLLKWLRGRQPTSVAPLSKGDGSIVLKVDGDNNSITITKQVYKLADSPAVRKAAANALKPLNDPGIDRFEVRDAGKPFETVHKDELGAFVPPLAAAAIAESADRAAIREQLVEVIKPSFSPELKWVFSDGSGGRMSALMKDSEFTERVQSGLRTFGKGDVLRVLVKSTPRITPEGLRTEHEVLKVSEEFNAPRQRGLLPSADETGEDFE